MREHKKHQKNHTENENSIERKNGKIHALTNSYVD